MFRPRYTTSPALSELAGLKLDERQADVLADMNQFNLEGRYPEFYTFHLRPKEGAEFIARSEEVLTWRIQQL